MKKASPSKKTSKNKTVKAVTRPVQDRKAEAQFHRFLDLWNGHIREQINVHHKILQGKQSLKQHVARTRKVHQKFLKQLEKI